MAKKKVTETEEAPRRSKRSREPVEPAADASAKKSKNEPAKKGKGASKGGKKTGDEDEAAAALTAIKKVSGEYDIVPYSIQVQVLCFFQASSSWHIILSRFRVETRSRLSL